MSSSKKDRRTTSDNDMFNFSSKKEPSAFLKFVEEGIAKDKSLQRALAMISRLGDKYMKKMYLRWKKMKAEEKQQYERAVASERRPLNHLSVTLDDCDETMETKVSTVKLPRLLPGAADARRQRRTKMTAVIKPKPKVGVVKSKMKTKHKCRPMSNKRKPSRKRNCVRNSIAKPRSVRRRLFHKLSVGGRTPITKMMMPRLRASKRKPVPQRATKPSPRKALKGKLAGRKTAPKSIRTIKKFKTRKTY